MMELSKNSRMMRIFLNMVMMLNLTSGPVNPLSAEIISPLELIPAEMISFGFTFNSKNVADTMSSTLQLFGMQRT